jgi:hypothetical protein
MGAFRGRSRTEPSLRWRRRRSRALATRRASISILQDIAGAGHSRLMEVRNQLLGLAAQEQAAHGHAPNGQEDTPQYSVEIDQEKASALTLPLAASTRRCRPPGAHLCQRLHRSRPRQEGLCAGRCALPHAAGGFGRWYVRNSGRRDGAVLGLLHRALELWLAAPGALQRRRRPSRSRARRRPASAPARPWTRSTDRWRSCRPASAMNGPGCRSRKSSPAARR